MELRMRVCITESVETTSPTTVWSAVPFVICFAVYNKNTAFAKFLRLESSSSSTPLV